MYTSNKLFNSPRSEISLSIDQKILQDMLSYQMELVERFMSINNIELQSVPYISASGKSFSIPGPLGIRSHGESYDDWSEGSTVSESEEEDDAVLSPRRNRFVVRNEFAHIRVQPLLDLLDDLEDDEDVIADDKRLDAIKIGGHCVLPPDSYEKCIENNWGIKHPFAGRFHPIAGNIIPETTLLYFTPLSRDQADAVADILLNSYQWASSMQKNVSK